MKKLLGVAFTSILLFTSCKGDDTPDCRICNSELTISFQLCKESNGNASVNGEDTEVGYAVYLDGLVNEGVECN
jgi:hypothetical protein